MRGNIYFDHSNTHLMHILIPVALELSTTVFLFLPQLKKFIFLVQLTTSESFPQVTYSICNLNASYIYNIQTLTHTFMFGYLQLPASDQMCIDTFYRKLYSFCTHMYVHLRVYTYNFKSSAAFESKCSAHAYTHTHRHKIIFELVRNWQKKFCSWKLTSLLRRLAMWKLSKLVLCFDN